MKKKSLILLILSLFFFIHPARANNIAISNVGLSLNTTDKFIKIRFDISWENSWRLSSAPSNHDAAWIFVKFRVAGGNWFHATLSNNPEDYYAPAGSTIDAVIDGKGVFMYRNETGTGTNTWSNAELHWNYSADGVADDATNVEVRVLAIEMVYIPEVAFFAGDNATSVSSFRQGSADNDPWYIGSEASLDVNDQAGSGTGIGLTNTEYYYVSGGNSGEDPTGSIFTIPDLFPKGYQSFYCMKYEITQGQYTEFLNLLTRSQQASRVTSTLSDAVTNIYVMSNSATELYRNSIVCPASGNGTTNPVVFTTSTPDLPCNYLSWADGAAYADWTGLRPMTELEFEKICRGPENPVSGEYAWGNATVANLAYTISNPGLSDENISSNFSSASGNASYTTTASGIGGPVRAGIYAANSNNTGRTTSGAGYYGTMEMSGNLAERLVTLGNSTGRNFSGLTGDGLLSSTGFANVSDWPGSNAIGSGLKGGFWSGSVTYIRVSIRNFAAFVSAGRGYEQGMRLIRCP